MDDTTAVAIAVIILAVAGTFGFLAFIGRNGRR